MNKNILKEFLVFKATKRDIILEFGEDLFNLDINPITISRQNVIFAIDMFLSHNIDKKVLLDWVNVIWFTDLYEYSDNEANSIVSVLDVLETFDEEGVNLTNEDLFNMKNSLLNNQEYFTTRK